MNAIRMSINSAKTKIPRQILEDVFVKRYQVDRSSPISLDERIQEEVILKMVLPDCQIEYGIITYLPLANAKVDRIHNQGFEYQAVYELDKSITGGRNIMSALAISYVNPHLSTWSHSMQAGGNSVILQAAQSLANANAQIPMTSSARVSLINGNTVLVRDTTMLPTNSYLMCIMENDDLLNTIRPKSIPHFKRLILLAIKAYIYNELVLELDQGKLVGGQELGRYREIVDSYSDAAEQYEELLDEKIGKIFFMNDEENMTRHVRLMLGGSR